MRLGKFCSLLLALLAVGGTRAAELKIVLTDRNTGQPVHNAVVSAQAADLTVSDTVEQAGAYRLTVAPGSYLVRAKAAGYALQDFQLTISGDTAQPVALSPVVDAAPALDSTNATAPSGNVATKLIGQLNSHLAWLDDLERRCADTTDPEYCALLTEVYAAGTLVRADAGKGLDYLDQECDLNSASACAKRGRQLPFPPPPGLPPASVFFNNFEAVTSEADCNARQTPLSCLLAGASYVSGIGVPKDSTRAATYLNRACQAHLEQACRENSCSMGQADQCVTAAAAYATGNGVFVSLERAALLYKLACDGDRAIACQSLSQLAARASPGPVAQVINVGNPSMSFTKATAQSCDRGMGAACRILGDMFLLGIDMPRDPAVALKQFDLACTLRDPEACTRLGRLYRDTPSIRDAAKADSYLRNAYSLNSTACDLGVPPFGCYAKGMALALGEGVPKDLGAALKNLDSDCRFWKMGYICRAAHEVRTQTKDDYGPEWKALPSRATAVAKFYARDCDSGGTASCSVLASFYQNGHGFNRDLPHATALYTTSCNAGVAMSCSALQALGGAAALVGEGKLCEAGSSAECVAAGDAIVKAGLVTSYEVASGYYENACSVHELGGCPGLVVVGDLFAGLPEPASKTRARQLWRTACVLDHLIGCERLVNAGTVLEAADEDTAVGIYIDACLYGGDPGCSNLWRVANKYSTADPPRSRAIWQRSCDAHVWGACNNYAFMVENGVGGPMDKNAALALYDHECSVENQLGCSNFYILDGTLHETRWVINYPPVDKPSTDMGNIQFKPNDQVLVEATGCLQTGGFGKTWKRYVDPIAPDSPQLYHGKIWIPGVTNGLENIQGWINRWLVVKPGAHDLSQMFLRLGYDDKPHHYGDNGYYDHDDGTDNQCAGIGAASVTITIRNHSKVPAGTSVNADTPLPMDMTFDEIDDNLVGVNPRWGLQVTSPGSLPEAGSLCNSFQETATGLDLGGCTRQSPTIDRITIDVQDVVEDPTTTLGRAVMYAICQAPLEQDAADPLKDSTVHGHINWGVASFQGKVYFEDFQVPPLSVGVNFFGDGDGDYDFSLVRPDQAGVLAHNKFRYKGAGPLGLTMEFNSSEVVDSVTSGWWDQFHKAVDANALHSNWSQPQSMVDGMDAKVVGLLGVDTKHSYHAELHPVFAMAIKVADAGGRQTWEIFARNWGDEGGCSRYQHYTNYNKLSFFFPKDSGTPYVVDNAVTSFSAHGAETLWGARQYDDGLVVSFELPPQQQKGLIYGELHLCKDSCSGALLPLNRSPLLVTANLAVNNQIAAPLNAPATPEPERFTPSEEESSFGKLLDQLTDAQKQAFLNFYREKRKQLQPTPIVNAAAFVAAIPPQPPPPRPQRDDTIVVARHRKLLAGEQPVVVQTIRRDNIDQIEKGKVIFAALEQATGNHQSAINVLKKLGPLPADVH